MNNYNILESNLNSNYLLCPNKDCINIPEIIYKFSPLKSFVQYKCNLHNNENLIQNELSQFLTISSHDILCPFCKCEIKSNINFHFCKQCNSIFDYNCFFRHNYSNRHHEVLTINQKFLYNNCLKHNNSFIFRCINCNESLCGKCDLNFHNFSGHELKQLINFSSSQNALDKIILEFEKQKRYLNKIKEMNNKIIKSLENDIIIKQKIIDNYKNNILNYKSIKNFNKLEIKNNEEYESLLKNIIEQYDEKEKNQNSAIDNDKNDDFLINQILSPFFYCMMINPNQDINNKLKNSLENKFNRENESIKDKNNNEEVSIRKKKNINNNNKNDEKEKRDEKEINKVIIEIKEKYDTYNEIKTIKFEKPINNMIILHSGNIALSSGGNIYIYNSNILSSPNKENGLIQKIEIGKGNKKIIKYIYEFPDETLLCSSSSKIYRLKLINNEIEFNILGFIPLAKSELPTKLISLGNIFLVVLSEQKKFCNLKLFIKKNYLKDNNLWYNNDKDNISSQNNEEENESLSDNSIGNKTKNSFNKNIVKEDKEFTILKKESINKDKKLLCSIFEIKKNIDDINYNKNECKFEFIATSNYTFDLGGDIIEFYEVKKLSNNSITISRTKKIENISCSTEADSICQLNDKYLCIGLQNFNLKGQISGYAIINIKQKEVSQIIKDDEIYSLNYNKEKSLLMASMEVRNPNGNYNTINMYKIKENDEDKFKFEKLCQLRSKHTGIIVSVIELKTMNCAPIARDFDKDFENLTKKNVICATASNDSTLRIIEAQI